MSGVLERLLNLRRGDLGRGLLLFSCLFLVITSYVVGKVARDALFLDKYQAVQLPYADLAGAAVVGIIVALYVRIGHNLSLPALLAGSHAFFAVNCLAFWVAAHYYRVPWLYPLLYVWVSIFGVLAPAQVWTLANHVLTTREAKRTFGLVGSGAIVGWIFAGFFSRVVAKHTGTENLLLGMTLFLATSAVLVVVTARRQQAGDVAGELAADAEQQRPSVWQSLKLVASTRYLLAIASVICASSFVTTVAGWQFKAIAKANIPQKDLLAVFFGDFNFYAGLICLATQLLLTSRLLRRFGIGPALFVVPLALMAGSVGILAWGTLAAAVLLKGSDQVLRYSIDKSTVELLYLPVSPTMKMQVKSFIDTVIWRFGDGLAAVALLIFATHFGVSARQIGWLMLVLISLWLLAALVARREYVTTLKESILQHRLDAERASAPVLDRSTVQVLVAKLAAEDPKEILYALSLFEMEGEGLIHPAIRGLLEHPSPEVREKALSLLARSRDRAVLSRVRELLKDPDLQVRTTALLYLTYNDNVDPLACIDELGEFPEYSVRTAVAAFLARPGESQNLDAVAHILDGMIGDPAESARNSRLEAAKLLAALPDHFEPQLARLIADNDPEILSEAFRAVGKLHKRRFIPELIEHLADPALREVAEEALAAFGDTVVGTLRDHLADPEVPLGVRREIPAVLGRMHSDAAARALSENLIQPDTTLRYRVIAALNRLYRDSPALARDEQMLETVLAAEILGHYRSFQILAVLSPGAPDDDLAVRGLKDSMQQELERVFRLLTLLHPNYDFHSAYVGLQSGKSVVRDNALEFLDNVLKPQLRNILVPLLDSEVSLPEKVRLADRLVRSDIKDRESAAAALVGSDDPWLRACGAYAIGSLGLTALAAELASCLEHPDPLLRETARQAQLRLAARA